MENKNQDVKLETPELDIDEKGSKKLQLIGIVVFIIIALVIAGLSFLSKKKEGQVENKKDTKIGTQLNNKDLKYTQDLPAEPKPVVVDNPVKEEKKEPETPNPFKQTEQAPKFSPKVFKSSGSFLIGSSGSASSGSDVNRTRSWKEQAEEEKGYSSGVFNAKSAHKLDFNPSLFLSKGTYIGCSLNTKLVSTIKGGISCTVSEDVYSEDGVTLLIEKGSKISGFFQSGQMENGMNRIFVLWQEIRTPNHINIPVFSGASDALGASGMEGYVDNHWLERFGGAVLISVIDDVFNYLANGKRDKQNGNYDYTQSTRENTQEMATKVIEEFIKIKPTLYKNQGELVGVYVNRDIDFSQVYRLRVK